MIQLLFRKLEFTAGCKGRLETRRVSGVALSQTQLQVLKALLEPQAMGLRFEKGSASNREFK